MYYFLSDCRSTFFSAFFFVLNAIVINILEEKSILPIFKDWIQSPFLLIMGILIPIIALILSFRYPPAPLFTFHSETQTVKWKSGANQLEISVSNIHFATSRLISKSGVSTVMVSIFAINNKPFFENETALPDPEMKYRKDLCIYKAGTQADADESIEIIKSFMAGTYNDSPSKFDEL